jgi:hypothetical protein
MKILPMLYLLLSAGMLRAAEGIRILSADPAANVLLEITTDTPRSVMSSSDLKTWKHVFHYLPACQNFKAYAPQSERRQTFFKLAPAHPSFQSLVLSDAIPTLAGKSFGTIGWNFSFSTGGTGTLNFQSFEGSDSENLSYSIVDSRRGMISVRTWIEDGHKIDHLILIPNSSAPPQFADAVVFTADRFGDLHSRTWTQFGSEDLHEMTFHHIGAEIPPAPVSWPDPAGMVVEHFAVPTEVVTLGPDGVASISAGGLTEAAAYDYVATGPTRATLQIQRLDGRKITAFLRAQPAQAFSRTAGLIPYRVSGTHAVEVVSYPGPTPP